MPSLRSLIVKIGADVTNVEKALASVGESAKTLDAGLKKLGTTPIGRQAIAGAEELAKSVKGLTEQQQKLANQSVLAARGLEAIGGPARLMTKELDQVARTVQRGLDAFRALGQEAPKELQKVSAAIQRQQQLLKVSAGGGGLQNALGGLGLGVGSLSGAAVGAVLASSAREAINLADSLTKLSDRTGIGTIALQRLSRIAEESGNSLDEIANAVNRLQRNIVENTSTTQEALARIGLTVNQLRALAPEAQFIAIAKGIQTIEDPAERAALAMELFGKSGASILPSLTANVDKFSKSFVEMSDVTVKNLDRLGDGFTNYRRSATNALGEVIGRLIQLGDVQVEVLKGNVAQFLIPTAPPTPPGQNIQLPSFRPPGAPSPEEERRIIGGLNILLAQHNALSDEAQRAYQRAQLALEQWAKLFTPSTQLIRAASDQLALFNLNVIDVQTELDQFANIAAGFNQDGTIVIQTLDQMIQKAKETEEAFRRIFGVTSGLSLALPPGVAPGNRDLINEARAELNIKPAEDSLRALSEAIGEFGRVAQGAIGDLTTGLAGIVNGVANMQRAVQVFGASSFTAIGAAVQLGIAIGQLIARFKEQIVAAFAAIGRGLRSVFHFLTFGLFSSSLSGGALTEAARRAAGLAATGGLVTMGGIQRFQEGGRVLPFLAGRGTDIVPALLTPGEVVLNKKQQASLASTLGGVQLHFDQRGAFFGAQAGEEVARIAMDAIVRRVSQNKGGAYTRLRGALGMTS